MFLRVIRFRGLGNDGGGSVTTRDVLRFRGHDARNVTRRQTESYRNGASYRSHEIYDSFYNINLIHSKSFEERERDMQEQPKRRKEISLSLQIGGKGTTFF